MSRLHTLASLLLLFVVSAGVAAQEPAQTTQSAAVAEPVRLNVMLTGGNGRAAPELKREDVRVFVDGDERPVVSFEKVVLPVSYGLVVDNSGSLRSQMNRVAAAARYLVEQNGPGDETFIVRFVASDNIQVLQSLTDDKAALNKALDSMYVQGGQTALLDALYFAGEYLTKNANSAAAPPRRRALLLVSDGEDRVSFNKVEEVLKLLKKNGVQVFCVGMTGELERAQGFVMQSKKAKAKDLLMKIATETGGRVFYAEKGKELEEAVVEVVENMHTQYVVGYEPLAAGKGHGKVEVRLVGAAGKEKLKAQIVAPAANE